jgi:cyclic beta-1,2-glucan synthetase
VACEFGYITVPELAQLTQLTLATIERMRKHHGHVLNWYNTQTLEPLPPFFVSSVDNGNLLASLWTLQQGCRQRLRQPVLQPCLLEGLLDALYVLADMKMFPRKTLNRLERERRTGNWLQELLNFPDDVLQQCERNLERTKDSEEGRRFLQIVREHLASIRQATQSFAPWSLPEFAELRDDPALNLRLMENLALGQLPAFVDRLDRSLGQDPASWAGDRKALYEKLRDRLAVARVNIASLIEDLRHDAKQAEALAEGMDFASLRDPRRRLLSIGMNAETGELHSACYDLLASESRTAMFVAIAKDDIPQECWFMLGRSHTLDQGRPVLLSWTGTMFEYLMPTIWMRSYPNTLLERSQSSAVHSQQAYAENYGVPWGISESGYAEMNETHHYHYHAFGIPQLALHKPDFPALVISPYSSFLALNIDATNSLINLQKMHELGWLGQYGFYEAADYTKGKRRFRSRQFRMVRSWMAHHQGMILLSLANFLLDGVVQRWFHSDRRVQATELLLHEKPVAHVPKSEVPRSVAVE